jgi:hypothetical protein
VVTVTTIAIVAFLSWWGCPRPAAPPGTADQEP